MKNLNIFSLITEYDNAKSGGVLNKPNVSFVNEDSSVRYLVDIKIEYEYVDLGLPSGLKWATCNVGATSPEEYGLYFAWGETTGYTAEQITSGVRQFTEDVYNAGPVASISTNLTLEQDAAHANMGGNWRMPTKEEYEELIDNCDDTWTDDYNGTGIKGRIFTSKVNGKSVFFPAAGWGQKSFVGGVGSSNPHWSASWDSSSGAWSLDYRYESPCLYKCLRYCGLPVRAVCK